MDVGEWVHPEGVVWAGVDADGAAGAVLGTDLDAEVEPGQLVATLGLGAVSVIEFVLGA